VNPDVPDGQTFTKEELLPVAESVDLAAEILGKKIFGVGELKPGASSSEAFFQWLRVAWRLNDDLAYREVHLRVSLNDLDFFKRLGRTLKAAELNASPADLALIQNWFPHAYHKSGKATWGLFCYTATATTEFLRRTLDDPSLTVAAVTKARQRLGLKQGATIVYRSCPG
jgi:hypothetical protein